MSLRSAMKARMMKETKRCRCNMLRGQRSFLVHSLSVRTKLCNTRGGTKVMPPIFFVRNCNYSYNEIDIYHECVLYKGQIIFPQILLYFQHTFPTLVTDAVCRSPKTSRPSLGDMHTYAVFCVSARCGPQIGLLGVHPSAGQSWKLEGAKSRL